MTCKNVEQRCTKANRKEASLRAQAIQALLQEQHEILICFLRFVVEKQTPQQIRDVSKFSRKSASRPWLVKSSFFLKSRSFEFLSKPSFREHHQSFSAFNGVETGHKRLVWSSSPVSLKQFVQRQDVIFETAVHKCLSSNN